MAVTTILDTATIPRHDLRDVFRDGLADTLGRFEVAPAGPGAMRQVFTAAGPAGCAIVAAASTPVTMTRLVDPGADEDIVTFNLVRTGVVHQTQRRRSVAAKPGEGFLDVLYEPLTFASADDHLIEWVALSRRRMATRVADVDAAVLRTATANPAALKLLSAYIAVLKASDGDAGVAAASDEHLHDLVALVLGPTGDAAAAAASGVRAARRAAIERHVARQLGDPALDAAAVGRAFGLSDRYIRMIFADTGGLADHIARARIAVAARMLRDPSFARLKIIDIAFRAGFNSLSVFNRQFQRIVGTTPSSFR